GTSIYPSDGSTGFTITNNIESTTGEVITTIAFDEFKEAMKKAASTIAKGDKGEKGDTGTVDNAGLTTAPAFVNLQTKVNNSAVGTNLLMGTATPASITGNNSVNQCKNNYILAGGMTAYALYQKYGSTFTLSFDWSVTDTANAYAGKMQQQFNYVPWTSGGIVNLSSSNTSGHVAKTFSLENDSANTAACFEFRLDNVPTTSTITVSNMKLEKGSVATDWCPNPTEILTQADYAKLKAAIISLGGHLS
ncbi:collagen-like protein, partial [Lactiplantibacillus plantarum]|uniref:collagen-like protein n=1 Tax=Lactiplantibacillus plantarum TaxID=1590 RepID=UPI0022389243